MNETIFLRELERTDLATLTRWRSDHGLVDLLGGSFRHVGSEADARWFDGYVASRSNNIRLAVCAGETAQMVGVVYLLGIDWINRSAEFSIQIGELSAQGRGIGEQATRLALRHAFGDLNLRRIHLTVLATNARARSLYEKAGFREEGVFRAAAYKNGEYIDLVAMALLRDDPTH
jgi:RimJ/RimL family protein N-acetyltransferase